MFVLPQPVNLASDSGKRWSWYEILVENIFLQVVSSAAGEELPALRFYERLCTAECVQLSEVL